MDPNSFSTFDLVGLLAMVFFAIIACFQAARANRLARAVARAEGTFRRANIEFSINNDTEVAEFIIALPMEEGCAYEMPLTYALHNNGDRTIDDLELSLRTSNNLRYQGAGSFEWSSQNDDRLRFGGIRFNKHTNTMSWNLDLINPGTRVVLNDIISILGPTVSDVPIEVTTKDGVDLILKIRMFAIYTLDFVLLQRDQRPVSKRLKLTIIDTRERTAQDIIRAENQVFARKERERRDSMTRLQLWREMIFGADHSHLVKILIPDPDGLLRDPLFPVYRFKKGATMGIGEGVKFANGYLLPGINVFPHTKK